MRDTLDARKPCDDMLEIGDSGAGEIVIVVCALLSGVSIMFVLNVRWLIHGLELFPRKRSSRNEGQVRSAATDAHLVRVITPSNRGRRILGVHATRRGRNRGERAHGWKAEERVKAASTIYNVYALAT
ncbi:hypothetical protein ANTQUA_LOCUS2093 [Anthophora quadrimaculata]